MRAAAILAIMVLATAPVPPAAAQDGRAQTLADIRQQLAVLRVELQGLTRELSTTGAPALGIAGTSFPDRVIALESLLQDLSAQTEQLSFRIDSVARDGGTRLEDLRFRLCELTPDCDIATLPAPIPLGGEAAATGSVAPTTPAAPATDAPQLAVGEQADFDAAMAALDDGRAEEAADRLDAFVSAYPTGPLTDRARVARGRALAQAGRTQAAARAYLDAFSGAPDGPQAPAALMGLGRSLGDLGQTDEACLTLDEVAVRFPAAPEVAQAQSTRAELGCS
ncbi:tetratricopeptide repeat protein [Jannaschia sp. LMIT008]|uniref:tetratricopeptide repeat protein n=1 Tax=Jannaschia maritima TaxID=3032585 RepID=UPI002811C5AD|nr:tetratricopeptide repeat protein [Jannaschia sp. LMIT008]